MTIEQIQEMITNKGDVREIINQLADYIQANPGGAPGGDQLLQSATVTLTDAQIKALPTTEVEIVAAPGADKMIYPVYFIAIITTAAGGEYTNISADAYINLETDTGHYGIITGNHAGVLNGVSRSLGTADNVGLVLAGPMQNGYYSSNFGALIPDDTQTIISLGNKALRLNMVNSGNLTGGNAANTLKVTVYYTVVDL